MLLHKKAFNVNNTQLEATSMKTKLLFGLSLLTYSLFSQAYDLTQLQHHLDRQQFKKLHQAIEKLPETPTQPELRVMQAKAMLSCAGARQHPCRLLFEQQGCRREGGGAQVHPLTKHAAAGFVLSASL